MGYCLFTTKAKQYVPRTFREPYILGNTMKTILMTIAFIFMVDAYHANANDTLTGGALMLEDIKDDREGMVEIYRKYYDGLFSKIETDFSIDFKNLLAECSAEMIVQEFEIMKEDEIDTLNANPKQSQALSDQVVEKCYSWITTETEKAKAKGTKQ